MPHLPCLLAGLLLACAGALAQTPSLPAVPLPEGLAAPRIDGALDDPAWAAAPVYSAFRRFRPDTQADPAPYRTEARVLVTPGALVFAIRAWDPAPQDIRAPLSRRDQVWPDQDSITIWIDPSGRGQVAQFVRVNAAGSVRDGLYSAAVDDEDEAPDFLDVEVATQRLSDGYSVEVRWPFANLRYPLNGSKPWGLMLTRRVPRDTHLSFSSGPLDREMPHLLVGLQPLQDETALRAQLAGGQHWVTRVEATLRHSEPGRTQANLGVELQWRPRADWVVDATLRPDFSQVELDDPQLAGNTRFALFLPEKRAFFLESSDVVGQVPPDSHGVSRGLLAFYSRAVSSPRLGLRATYRGETQEATALLLRDAGGGLLQRPSSFGTALLPVNQPSQLLFARHRTQLSPELALAGVTSLRDWGDGARTAVAGIDGLWTPSGQWQLRGHWLASSNGTQVDADQRIRRAETREQDSAFWLNARWRDGDWRLSGDLERIGARFVNDNGFVPQSGIARVNLEGLRAFHGQPGDFLTVWEALMRATATRALQAEGVARAQTVAQLLQPGVWALGPASTEAWLHANFEQQRTRAGGPLHRPRSLLLGLGSHPGPRLSYITLEATVGERVDQQADRVGDGFNLFAQATWRQPLPGGRHLEAEQRFSQGRIRAKQGPGLLDETSAQTKLLLHLNREQALRLLWQVQRLQRSAEPGLLLAEAARNRTGTFTWLARAGSLRGWSLGSSWSRDDGAAVQRELFVKFQQGW